MRVVLVLPRSSVAGSGEAAIVTGAFCGTHQRHRRLGHIAQLARASRLHRAGRGFESLCAHWNPLDSESSIGNSHVVRFAHVRTSARETSRWRGVRPLCGRLPLVIMGPAAWNSARSAWMEILSKDFVEFIECCVARDVKFLIVGG